MLHQFVKGMDNCFKVKVKIGWLVSHCWYKKAWETTLPKRSVRACACVHTLEWWVSADLIWLNGLVRQGAQGILMSAAQRRCSTKIVKTYLQWWPFHFLLGFFWFLLYLEHPRTRSLAVALVLLLPDLLGLLTYSGFVRVGHSYRTYIRSQVACVSRGSANKSPLSR